MPGIHRERPGADAIAPATDAPAVDVGDGVWLSPGLSNSYLITTADGRVVVNAGMGFEGPLHRAKYDAVDDSPIRAVVLTQGHYDHVGGLPVLVDEGTDLIAQANHQVWRDDNRRLEAFRSRNSAFAWIDAILAAMEHTRALGVEAAPSELPEPTVLVDERLELTVGDRRLVLVATPGGETFDSLVVWLPASRTLLSGNLTGPLFGHVPNLVTIRGDRYRDALTYIDSLEIVKELRPERLLTGHFDPIEGADRIAEEVSAMQEAMAWVHDRTVDGMNAGEDVWTLMRTVRVPGHLDLGEGYGTTPWNVRAIWENYAGWFHHRSTTELYGVAPLAVAPDLVAAAGADPLVAAAQSHLDGGRPVEALQLTDVVLGVERGHAGAKAVAVAAHEALLDASVNFWERAWLRRSIEKLAR
ncbi:MAG: MBL fold metallo-hydrolase [Acidimicrobiales bacterium]|nr:MBL fold metallo-hydrolase [Acidimicrobiales bacterium]MCB1017348.1 MBL fold metallo-hydrolase [Acidimicrobiales bacterium]